MGWWRIDRETGGIGGQPAGEDSRLVNALPGVHSPEHYFNGDEPADVMAQALREIEAVYREAWGRPPAEEELRAVFEFVLPKDSDADGP